MIRDGAKCGKGFALLPKDQEPPFDYLRLRHVLRWRPTLSREILRKWEADGLINPRIFQAGWRRHYLKWEIKKQEGLPFQKPALFVRPKQTPLPPLLRLRGVEKRIGFSRHLLELMEATRSLTPFRKHKTAKALYRTWQFLMILKKYGDDPLKIIIEPVPQRLRRFEVITWLGITAAELDSWVHLGVVRTVRVAATGKYFYLKADLKKNVLGLRG